jgi:hypothetical protein
MTFSSAPEFATHVSDSGKTKLISASRAISMMTRSKAFVVLMSCITAGFFVMLMMSMSIVF